MSPQRKKFTPFIALLMFYRQFIDIQVKRFLQIIELQDFGHFVSEFHRFLTELWLIGQTMSVQVFKL